LELVLDESDADRGCDMLLRQRTRTTTGSALDSRLSQ